MHRMPLPNNLQAIPHKELIVPRREQRRRHINQDGDPGVILVGEGLATEEYRGDDARAQVTGEIGGDGYAGEAPDHSGVGETYGEGDGDGGYEGVGGVQARPEYDADEGVDEEFYAVGG